jgi:hypothetical protein
MPAVFARASGTPWCLAKRLPIELAQSSAARDVVRSRVATERGESGLAGVLSVLPELVELVRERYEMRDVSSAASPQLLVVDETEVL